MLENTGFAEWIARHQIEERFLSYFSLTKLEQALSLERPLLSREKEVLSFSISQYSFCLSPWPECDENYVSVEGYLWYEDSAVLSAKKQRTKILLATFLVYFSLEGDYVREDFRLNKSPDTVKKMLEEAVDR